MGGWSDNVIREFTEERRDGNSAMKECAICGEKVEDHAIRCSKGHMRFIPPRRQSSFKQNETIRQIIRQEYANYDEKKVDALVEEVKRICTYGRFSITSEVVKTIATNIETYKLLEPIEPEKRKEIEKKIEREKLEERERQERAMRDEIVRQQRQDENDREVERFFDIHSALPHGNRYPVRRHELVKLLADSLNLVIYQSAVVTEETLHRVDRLYRDNRSFWLATQTGDLVQGMRIHLQEFHLTQWIPSAPGRYYTSDAISSRRRAQHYLDRNLREYLPLGKELMVLGGVGSVRLGERHIGTDTFYILGATSSGVSHQGIPVMLSEDEYHKVIPFLRNGGGCIVNLTGRLRVFPTRELLINYDRQIPRYIIYAENVDVVQESHRLLVTVALTFSRREADIYYSRDFPNKYWAFCSFDPITQNVDAAVEWLEDYALRYFHSNEILNDFDELYQHFNSVSVEFPIGNVLSGNINLSNLRAYQSSLHFHINRGAIVTMGDIFSNITGSTIVNRASVEESFNKIENSYDRETANALLQAAEEIARANNREASELFASFNEELQKANPRKVVLKRLWNGILSILPSLAQLADVGVRISKLFIEQ